MYVYVVTMSVTRDPLLYTVLCLSDQQPAGGGLDRTAGAQPVPDLPDR